MTVERSFRVLEDDGTQIWHASWLTLCADIMEEVPESLISAGVCADPSRDSPLEAECGCVVSKADSAELQRFVAAVQVLSGEVVATASATAIPALFKGLVETIPLSLNPVADRIVREIVIDIAIRLQARLLTSALSFEVSRRITQLRTVLPSGLRSCFSSYLSDVEVRLGATSECTQPQCCAAIAYILAHYANPLLSVSDVAQSLRISKWHLERLLRAHTRKCFLAHLHEARLAAAQELIVTKPLSIKEIASAVGYASTTAFDRHFGRRFGCAPTAWRRAHQARGLPLHIAQAGSEPSTEKRTSH